VIDSGLIARLELVPAVELEATTTFQVEP